MSPPPLPHGASPYVPPVAASPYTLTPPHPPLTGGLTENLTSYVRVEQVGEGTYGQVYKVRQMQMQMQMKCI